MAVAVAALEEFNKTFIGYSGRGASPAFFLQRYGRGLFHVIAPRGGDPAPDIPGPSLLPSVGMPYDPEMAGLEMVKIILPNILFPGYKRKVVFLSSFFGFFFFALAD